MRATHHYGQVALGLNLLDIENRTIYDVIVTLIIDLHLLHIIFKSTCPLINSASIRT